MYIAGFVIPVPEEKMEAYRKWAENGAAIFREYGCIEIVDSWEDNVPGGKYTDFRRAVDAKDGEKIVFSWQVWPDKATLDSAEAKCTRTSVWRFRVKFRSTPSALSLVALSHSTQWAASEMSLSTRCGPFCPDATMTALGQKRRFDCQPITSSLPLINGHSQSPSACLNGARSRHPASDLK